MNEKYTIPYTSNRYFLLDNDKILDIYTGKHLTTINEKYEIVFDIGNKDISLSFLKLLTHRPLFKLEKYFLNWRVGYRDNDENNININNLYWKPPKGGQFCPDKEGYNVIPGFSKMAVDRFGNIYTRFYKRSMIKVLDKDGYYNIRSASTDVINKKKHLRICRAVAMAWIECPDSYDKFQVNHKDSNRSNDYYENLEWVTPRQNIQHGIKYGNIKTTQLIIKDILTNKLYKLNSVIDASRFLNIYPAILDHYIKKDINKIYSNKFIIIDYGEIEDDRYIDAEIVFYSENCIGYNILEDKIYLFDSPYEANLYSGIERETIRNKLYYSNPWPNKNWCFMWLDDFSKKKTFRKFSKEEVEFFRNKRGVKNPVKLTNLDTNEIKFYDSVKKIANKLNVSVAYISNKCCKGFEFKLNNIRYKVEKFTLK